MTRLDGEKKSPLPYIIGLLVLAVLAAGIYYFMSQNRGADETQTPANSVELQDARDADNSVDANATDANSVDANATDANSADANTVDANAMDANAVDSNAVDSNAVDANSVDANAMDTNAVDSNAAMSNSTLGGSAISNSAPAMTPAPMSSGVKTKDSSQVVAERSKTIKQGNATVTYTKKVLKDGSTQREKIPAEPVKDAR